MMSPHQRTLISTGALTLAKFVVPYYGATDDRIRQIASLLHRSDLKGRDRQIVTRCACHLLGVCLQDPSDDAHREALGALAEHLRSRHGRVFRVIEHGRAAPIWNLNPPLGAIALILLSHEGFVHALGKQEQQVESLLAISGAVLDTIVSQFGSLEEPEEGILKRFFHTMRCGSPKLKMPCFRTSGWL